MTISSSRLYQIFKYAVYAFLAVNVYLFYDEESAAATKRESDCAAEADGYNSPSSSPGASIVERKSKTRWKTLRSRMSAVNMFSTRRTKTRKSSRDNEDENEVRGKLIGEFGANEVFGTLAFLTSSNHMMTVKAASMVLYLHIPSNVVTKMLSLLSKDGNGNCDGHEIERVRSTYREKTSHIAFDKAHDFDIEENTASEFIKGCCRHAGLQAALTVLEVKIISYFNLRPSEFRNAMTNAVRNATYLRQMPGHTVNLSTPAILLTGALRIERVDKEGVGDEEDGTLTISGISFVTPRSGIVYRAAIVESGGVSDPVSVSNAAVQMLVLSQDDCDNIRAMSAQKTRRRRYVQQLSRALSSSMGSSNPSTSRKKSFFGF